MTKYGISAEGASALHQLATDMSTINDDIQQSGDDLQKTIDGLGDGLGVYENEISELVTDVNIKQERGRESVEHLTSKVSEMADNIEELVNSGL